MPLPVLWFSRAIREQNPHFSLFKSSHILHPRNPVRYIQVQPFVLLNTVLKFTFGSANRQFPSVTIPSNPQGATWAHTGLLDLDFSSFETPLLDDLSSASAYAFYPSHPDPWSPIQQRNHGSIGSDANLCGPASDLHDNYAQSAFSWQSSPKFQNANTPSSTRSPVSPRSNLNHASRQTPPLVRPTIRHPDQTPRPSQNVFAVNTRGIPTFDFAKTEPESPQQLQCRALSIDRSSHVDALGSPAPSDFVVVNNQGSEKASSPVVADAKSWHIPSPKANQTQTVFVTQVFSANEDGSARQSSSGAIRRASGKRAGGRPLGSHLPSDKAARAKQLREEGVCWLCCLQRDSCSPGEVCDRCVKRAQRGDARARPRLRPNKAHRAESFLRPRCYYAASRALGPKSLVWAAHRPLDT